MDKHVIPVLMFFGLVVLSCDNSGRTAKTNPEMEGVQVINLAKISPVVKEIYLSEIARDVEYIPLEYNEESILTNAVNRIKILGDRIFLDQFCIIKEYDISGKFVRDLNKGGRGPGESICLGFAIDPDSSIIYVVPGDKHFIMAYNLNNSSYKDMKNIPSDESVADVFFWKRNFFTIYSHSSRLYPPYFLKVIDVDRDTIVYTQKNNYNYVLPELRGFAIIPVSDISIQEYENQLLLKDVFNDTVFKTSDLRYFEPKYIFQFGSRRLDYEEYMNSCYLMEPMKTGTLIIQDFFETKHDVLFRLIEKHEMRDSIIFSVFNKNTKELKFSYNRTIINDIDNGPDLNFFDLRYINYGSLDGKFYLYTLVFPEELLKFSDGNNLNTKPLDKVKNEALINIINNIDLMDNPVLMKIELKSQN